MLFGKLANWREQVAAGSDIPLSPQISSGT